MKNKSNQHPKQKSTATTKNKRPWLIPGVVILAAVVGVIFWMNKRDNQTINNSASTPPTNVQAKASKDLLIGRWVRTDSEGNYIIEIKNVIANGKLDAQYFNPNPIKVGRAEWQQKNGSLMMVVELRDVNYPGSTYTLNLLSGGDRLTGNYYQAVEGTNFDVEFVRSR
jgi:hypothetical protein